MLELIWSENIQSPKSHTNLRPELSNGSLKLDVKNQEIAKRVIEKDSRNGIKEGSHRWIVSSEANPRSGAKPDPVCSISSLDGRIRAIRTLAEHLSSRSWQSASAAGRQELLPDRSVRWLAAFPASSCRMQLQRRPTAVPTRSELDHTSGCGHTNDPNTS